MNVFDTQEAVEVLNGHRIGMGEAPLPLALGHGKTGMPGLLECVLHVPTPPDCSQEDWTQRPLPDAMARYAAGDVHHLLPLTHALWRRLVELPGSLSLVETNCRKMCKVKMHYRTPADAEHPWSNDVNFKNSLKITNGAATRSTAVTQQLHALSLWRDNEARTR